MPDLFPQPRVMMRGPENRIRQVANQKTTAPPSPASVESTTSNPDTKSGAVSTPTTSSIPSGSQNTTPGFFSATVTTPSTTPLGPSTTLYAATTGNTLSESPSTSSSNSISSSASPTASPTSASDTGLGPGAVAGISIGTFFVGVLLALFCACLFAMQRRKKRRSHDSANRQRPYRDSEYSQEYGTPMKQMTSSIQPVGAGNDMNLNRILLEPVSTSDIKTEMLAIGSQILQHVDNNYHLKPVDSLPATFTEILTQDRYSDFSGISIEQLSNLLRNVKTRHVAIRHVISYFIFSKITFTSDIETSLLPSYVIAFLKKMPPPERISGSREAFDQVLTKWRLLSAYLLQTIRSNRDPLLPQDNDIQPAITRNVAAVRQILTPFVVPGAERRQAENLQGLMAEGAKFGLLLFQHPESWVVDWEVPRVENSDTKTGGSVRAKLSAIVVFPGLIKSVDGEGKRYGKFRAVLDAEVLQL